MPISSQAPPSPIPPPTEPSSADAQRVFEGHLSPTPVATSQSLNRAWGCTVWLKLEMLHTTGSFKERGALYKLNSLTPEQREKGVVAASAGNHAQALAFHAAVLKIPCTIVMPTTAPLIKVRNTASHGARVILEGCDYHDAMLHACTLRDSEGQTYISGFDDPWIMAGQGTIGLELLEQCPRLDYVIVPLGGGGLIAGIATAIKERAPHVKIIGVQTTAIPSARAALEAGTPVEVPAASTLADGIAVRKVGKLCLDVIREHVDQIVEVGENAIAQAVLLMLEQEKAVVEGAGAVGVAALQLGLIDGLAGKNVAVVLSGGNIDVNRLSRIIDKGLVENGRLVRLRLLIPDVPGELAKILDCVASCRANIMEVQHQRAFANAPVGRTGVELTLETRGKDHLEEILSCLQSVCANVVTLT